MRRTLLVILLGTGCLMAISNGRGENEKLGHASMAEAIST